MKITQMRCYTHSASPRLPPPLKLWAARSQRGRERFTYLLDFKSLPAYFNINIRSTLDFFPGQYMKNHVHHNYKNAIASRKNAPPQILSATFSGHFCDILNRKKLK